MNSDKKTPLSGVITCIQIDIPNATIIIDPAPNIKNIRPIKAWSHLLASSFISEKV